MKLLRQLAEERGVSFAYPTTGGEARSEIDRLLAMPRNSRAERRREAHAVRADIQTVGGDAARVRLEELSGYGSSATWRSGR